MTRKEIRLRLLVMLAMSWAAAACSTQPRLPPSSPQVPVGSSATTVASWYGPGFLGHRTSSGEIYDAEDLTAASTLFPLGTRLMVTNLNNGRSVEVVVNDHGPFVKGRQLDLSKKAARLLGMIGPGTAPVRMDVLSTPPGGPPIGQRYFVQVGSFSHIANAQRMRAQVAQRYPDVRLEEVSAGVYHYYRVRMGAFSTRDEARLRAVSLSGYGYPVVIVSE